jgi:hypothetical protein
MFTCLPESSGLLKEMNASIEEVLQSSPDSERYHQSSRNTSYSNHSLRPFSTQQNDNRSPKLGYKTPPASREGKPERNEDAESQGNARAHESVRKSSSNRAMSRNGMAERDEFADFFSPEIFQIVLRNPTTAHRFRRFCQARDCGESMEFLEKVCRWIFYPSSRLHHVQHQQRGQSFPQDVFPP